MKIGTRLVLLFVGITLISTAFVAMLGVHSARLALRQSIGGNYQNLASEGAGNIEVLMHERILETEHLAKRQSVLAALRRANHAYEGKSDAAIAERIQAIDAEWIASRAQSAAAGRVLGSALSDILREWMQAAPHRYGEIFVTDRHGAVVGATGRLSDYQQADEQWWQESFASGRGEVFLDDRGHDETANAMVVGVAAPVRDGDRVIGIIKTHYTLDALLALPLTDRLPEGTRTFLARANGRIIAYVGKSGAPVLRAPEKAAMRAKLAGWSEAEGDAGWRLRAYAPVPLRLHSRVAMAGAQEGISGERWEQTAWYVFLDVPSRVAFAPLAALQKMTTVTALVALLIAGLVAVATARSISRPLRALRDGAEKIAGGDLGLRLAVESGDEVGELAAAFNRMAESLQTQVTALSDSEQRLRLMTSNIRDYAIFMLDPRGHVVTWNAGARRLKGYEDKDIIGQQFSRFYPPEDLAIGKPAALLGKAAAEGRAEDTGWRVRKDGSRFFANVIINAIHNENGEQVGFVNITRDITAHKQAEEALQKLNEELERRVAERTAQLAASNRELERFAYVASHDLQEPLRTVASYLQLVERRYKDRLDDNGREFIDFAVDGATRMQGMIRDLLDYSRVQTQGRPFAPVDLNGVLDEVIGDLRLAIGENAAKVTHDTLPVVTGDESQLRRLLQNLVGNAIKYRGEAAPRIHVAASRIEGAGIGLPDGAPPRGWLLSVQDNGIGIEAKYYEKIFQLFHRLHGRESYPGTGLGLALCKRIVERHGGAIWVESVPGEGSTFYVALPDEFPRQGAA